MMIKKRVLIVEDQAITAFDESEIMRELGYYVTGIAMSAEEAIGFSWSRGGQRL